MDPYPPRLPVVCAGDLTAGRLPPAISEALADEDFDAADVEFAELYEVCAGRVKAAAQAEGDCIYVCSRDLAGTRAALLAVRELTQRPAVTAFSCGEHGKIPSGTEIAAAYIVMQSMGARAFCIGSREALPGRQECLDALLQEMAPYARIPVMVAGRDGKILYTRDPDAGQIEDTDRIPCATGKSVQYVAPTIDVGAGIVCSPSLALDVLAAEEDPAGAMKIVVESEDDLAFFEREQYMIGKALCLGCEEPELFAQALRVFHGRAFYDGTNGFDPGFLREMEDKYGLVCL